MSAMTEQAAEPYQLAHPADGWTVEHLDRWPESHVRYELTDGALTVSRSPSSLHQAVSGRLIARLDDLAPSGLAATGAVEIRFGPQLTRIPDLLVVRSGDPGRQWFAPSEVVLAVEIESPGSHIEDRVVKPAIYAAHGIRSYWRIELGPIRARRYGLAPDADGYRELDCPVDRIVADEPFAVDVPLAGLLPGWAR
ncbi:MAG: Uma2 family endonuclease [Actinomycetota bacterium]|nr:Uma2 family endonuclease [Actinomycetota bacterium]